MKPTLGDLVRLHLAELDAIDAAQLAIAALMLVAIGFGAVALVRSWRGDRRPETAGRWAGLASGLALLVCVLAVAGMAWHQWASHTVIVELGMNVTPADVSQPLTDSYLGLAFGLILGAVGLALAWALEWFAEALAEGTAGEGEA